MNVSVWERENSDWDYRREFESDDPFYNMDFNSF